MIQELRLVTKRTLSDVRAEFVVVDAFISVLVCLVNDLSIDKISVMADEELLTAE